MYSHALQKKRLGALSCAKRAEKSLSTRGSSCLVLRMVGLSLVRMPETTRGCEEFCSHTVRCTPTCSECSRVFLRHEAILVMKLSILKTAPVTKEARYQAQKLVFWFLYKGENFNGAQFWWCNFLHAVLQRLAKSMHGSVAAAMHIIASAIEGV